MACGKKLDRIRSLTRHVHEPRSQTPAVARRGSTKSAWLLKVDRVSQTKQTKLRISLSMKQGNDCRHCVNNRPSNPRCASKGCCLKASWIATEPRDRCECKGAIGNCPGNNISSNQTVAVAHPCHKTSWVHFWTDTELGASNVSLAHRRLKLSST